MIVNYKLTPMTSLEGQTACNYIVQDFKHHILNKQELFNNLFPLFELLKNLKHFE